jgi:hypothetical protein
MSEKTVVITEKADGYKIENSGMSEFALIGILECILFDLKKAGRRGSTGNTVGVVDTSAAAVPEAPVHPEPLNVVDQSIKDKGKETPADRTAGGNLELRTRIGNAVKAIKNLGGEVGSSDLTGATDEELQAELNELTDQYKRLKNSQKASK